MVVLMKMLSALCLARLAGTCSAFRCGESVIVHVLMQRASARSRVHRIDGTSAGRLRCVASQLAWLEWRYFAERKAKEQVASSMNCSFFIGKGGVLVSCGRRDYGSGHAEFPWLVIPSCIPALTGIRITRVSGGFGYAAAVSESGVLFTWGTDLKGRLGHGGEVDVFVPKQVEALRDHPVLCVSLGGFHGLAVTEAGFVFGWGDNGHGQCGHGMSCFNVPTPTLIKSFDRARVRDATCGCEHSIVVTDDGSLYSFGLGCFGQLGHGSIRDEHAPMLVKALHHMRVVCASAGDDNSIVVGEDGSVFAWGANNLGQLGMGYRGGVELLPREVETFRGLRVCTVQAGGGNLLSRAGCALTSDGELFTWGEGKFGRLGHGDTMDVVTPRRVEALRGQAVVAVSASCTHILAVTVRGAVFGWGKADPLGDIRGCCVTMTGADSYGCVLVPWRYPFICDSVFAV